MYVTVTSGPMYQGKTKDIIAKAKRAEELGLELTVLKPSKDIRYTHAAVICAHDGDQWPCTLIESMDDILSIIKTTSGMIIIDEFFMVTGDPIAFFLALVKVDRHISIYGLDLDSEGKTWPQMDAAHAYANSIKKMFTLNDDSILMRYTQKLKSTGNKEDVAGAKLFAASTARDWKPLK